jgi:ABC-type nitrate/sulfonate/bicarbonate transport system permease component
MARLIVRLIGPLALALAWELFARSGRVTAFMLPPFSAVVGRVSADLLDGSLLINAGETLWRALLGFVIAALAGVLLALLMARSRIGRWFFDPVISVLFPMPKIAFLPIVILWLGVYDASKIAMVVFDAVFPVLTATIAGMAAVETELVWSARNMGATDREVLWQIMLPAALPRILTGLQIALPVALIVTVVCEMLMGGYGLGGTMMTASRFADSRGVFAALLEIAVIGYALVRLAQAGRIWLLPWHAEAAHAEHH